MLNCTSIYRRKLHCLLLPSLAGFLALPPATALPASAGSGSDGSSPPFEAIAELEKLAAREARQVLPALNSSQRLVVGPIQSRLQLPLCEPGVQASRAPGIQQEGRVMVELRCAGKVPWHLYVPVKTVGTTPVVVAAHSLIAGSVLTEKDLAVEQRDVAGLPPGYLNDPAIAVGFTAGRGISGGAILTNQQLLGSQAVQRGQTVTLVADNGGISVRMAGRALSDGVVNQRVRVENLSSGKIVEGIAKSPQVVQINF